MVVKLMGIYGGETTMRVHRDIQIYPGTPCLNPTALDCAVGNSHMEIVKLLAPIPIPVRNGDPAPSIADAFETHEQYLSVALLEAARIGNMEIAEYLMSQGADINFFDDCGTPLYHAAAARNPGLVQFFLASGADPNCCNETGETPLFSAAEESHDMVLVHVAALLAAGADVHAKTRLSRNVLMYCASVEMFRYFLERGVDPNNEDNIGNTPLHWACLQGPEVFSRACVELLLEFGAGPVDKTNGNGQTCVEVAMTYGFAEIVNILEPLVQNPRLRTKIEQWRGKRERKLKKRQEREKRKGEEKHRSVVLP